MPAWTAGIQIRKDAAGNVHVNLGSSHSILERRNRRGSA